MTQIHWMLLATGYEPRSEVSVAVSRAITKAFELMGHSCAGAIINYLSKIHNLPPHAVVARYGLVGKAIG
jgi:succinyl-CoA synthetase alpha subunit